MEFALYHLRIAGFGLIAVAIAIELIHWAKTEKAENKEFSANS